MDVTQKTTSLEAILAEPVDLARLIEHLDFTEENLIQANREQPALFLEASRYRVKRMRQRITAETLLDTEKAQAGIFFRLKKRNEKDKGKGSTLTEAYIKEKVIVDKSVVAAREAFDKATVYEEWARHLLDAYKQRGYAIQNLAELLGAEAFAQAKLGQKELEIAGLEQLKKAVRAKYPGKSEE